MSTEDRALLLGTILAAWKEDLTATFTLTQMEQVTQVNRRELKGAVEVLVQLLVLEPVSWSKTHKAVRLNTGVTYHGLIDRIHQVLPEAPDQWTADPAEDMTEAQWKAVVAPLVRGFLPATRLRWYITHLQDETDSYTFIRTIARDCRDPQWSPQLSRLEREYRALQLERWVDFGVKWFDISLVLELFQQLLDEKPTV